MVLVSVNFESRREGLKCQDDVQLVILIGG
jgi:hypothetical protein